MLTWIDESPELFVRSGRTLGKARLTMATALARWAGSERESIGFVFERAGDPLVKVLIGGPNAIMREVDGRASDLSAATRAEIRAGLEALWSRGKDVEAMPTLVCWETSPGHVDMVAMTIDPNAFAASAN